MQRREFMKKAVGIHAMLLFFGSTENLAAKAKKRTLKIRR